MATPLSPTARNLAHGFVQDNASVEQEQDANWALTELDKGLRSLKLGVQCESVVRFPRLFEKYPFPILINSAFLRLADVFRGGNNFLRWCILGVTQQSQKHLDKVLNIDEIMRRIFQVIHSNDPVARALTLRTLGSIASIIPERKNVHHTIVSGLDSHDAVEVDAAAFYRVNKKNGTDPITEPMRDIQSQLGSSHPSSINSSNVCSVFNDESLMPYFHFLITLKFWNLKFLPITFAANICSKMANMIEEIATPVDLKLRLIPVLQHMHHDAITAAKARSVCIRLLSSFPAQKFVTLILSTMTKLAADSLVDIQNQVELLIIRLKDDPRKTIKLSSLHNLNILAKRSPHQWKYSFVEPKDVIAYKINLEQLLDVCNLCYVSDNCILSSQAVEFYCNLAICYKRSKGLLWDIDHDLEEGARLAVTAQMCLSAWKTDVNEQRALKVCLCCAVKLVKSFPNTADFFVTEIVQLLETVNEKNAVLLCECLAAIGSENNKMVVQIIPQLLSLFQIHTNVTEGLSIPVQVKDLLSNSIKNSANPWFAYKLGRQAMRYGQYPVATEIFNILSQEVASEHFHFWLLGLQEICTAESCLQSKESKSYNDITRVDDTLIHYQKGLASLNVSNIPCIAGIAASTPNFPMLFQSEFVNLRVSLLQVHSQLIRTCNTFRTCPPPAIATALAMTNGQDISRCGQIISQLEKCVKSYDKLSNMSAALYQRSFDADPISLNSLQQFGQMLSVPTASSNTGLDIALQDINKQFNELIQNNSSGQALTHQHINLLCQSVQTFINTPLRYPRFFFQSLQSTTLKEFSATTELAVTPQHNIQMDPILVHHNTFQTIKIEGIILHGQRRELFRKIDKVHMSVKFKSHQQRTMTGLHKLDMEAAVIDESGTLWNIGPSVSLTIKSYDDSIMKKQTKAASIRTSFGQMPTPP
ncbi:hypothetical protein KUTeg_014374 [Tegillarca granosa]|uniref:Integrator complex subunit 7 n=1 Tax=Tegillarca granosa TaxID=220873 RepID=A0ABQ9EWC9_TEGGR|nr:hypothetical protein KUTeg_014374 [Tegillarca granosa]